MTPPEPSVSVVIPTYNRVHYLKPAIESALAQVPPPGEVVVVDDGSTDATPELLEKFPQVVHVRRDRQASSTPAAARNAGLRVAQGEYVAFLDDDDLWLPGKLQAQLLAMKANDLVLVSTDAQVIDEDGNLVRERYLDASLPTGSLEALVVHNWVIASTVMARRDVLFEVGGFNESPSLRAVEDYELWLRVAARGEMGFINEPLARYREHGSRLSVMTGRKVPSRTRALRSVLNDPRVKAAVGGRLQTEIRSEHLQKLRDRLLSIVRKVRA